MVPDLRSLRDLAHPFRNDSAWTISRVNHGLTLSFVVPSLPVLCLDLSDEKSVTSGRRSLVQVGQEQYASDPG